MSQRYRTIVADPPWDVTRAVGGHGGNVERRQERRAEVGGGVSHPLDYVTMTVAEIKALPVKELAATDSSGQRSDGTRTCPRDGSTLYLWTTTAFLYDAHDVARCWGFTPTVTLVWCKPHGGLIGGTFYPNVEFVIVARRGQPKPATGTSTTRWFEWPRGEHSQKPDAFLDLVEQVSPGPYVELFARRARFGWDYWGDQSLGTAALAEGAA